MTLRLVVVVVMMKILSFVPARVLMPGLIPLTGGMVMVVVVMMVEVMLMNVLVDYRSCLAPLLWISGVRLDCGQSSRWVGARCRGILRQAALAT